MAGMLVRWLHLSDLHERPEHGRDVLYREILDHVAERVAEGRAPHMVFLTGDLAFMGLEEQYKTLEENFLTPLRQCLGERVPFFMVPGNHDLKRDGCYLPTANEYPAMFKADSVGQQKRRSMALLRFGDFQSFATRWGGGDWGTRWLDTQAGTVGQSVSVGEKEKHRIAVVGVNTAWLCNGNAHAPNDEDWGDVTPGFDLVRDRLDSMAKGNPDLTIVLGHHPLESFLQADIPHLRTLFKKHRVLYLHGHLHMNSSTASRGELVRSYAVQAGAAFQAHDDAKWRNGLLWGEVDLEAGKLFLEPLKHNLDHGWFFDTEHFDPKQQEAGRNAFWSWLPGRGDAAAWQMPNGWRELDGATIAGWRQAVTDVKLKGFFDGRSPDWAEVSSVKVQPLSAVGRIWEKIQAIGPVPNRAYVIRVHGPGGEGKSTAGRQAALKAAENGWRVLAADRDALNLPDDLADLPQAEGRRWLVVVDDADLQADRLFATLKALAERRRVDVHFLLIGRETDWRRAVPDGDQWQRVAEMERVEVHGLPEEDARRIAQGWAGVENRDEAADVALLRAEAKKGSTKEGVLFGALLGVRRDGDKLPDHVRKMLDRLKDLSEADAPLLRAYAMMAAMEADMVAEGLDRLDRHVLAHALELRDEHALEDRVLVPLAREVGLSRGVYVRTRHPQIAREVVKCLRQGVGTYGIDVDQLYVDLAATARRRFAAFRNAKEARRWLPDINVWTFDLATHFVKKSRQEAKDLAVRIARAVAEADPARVEPATAYARILRKADRPQDALEMLRHAYDRHMGQRGYFREWSTVAGACKQYDMDVWLAARSLADGGPALSGEDAGDGLSNLGHACSQAGMDEEFRRGRAACARLGLRLTVTPRSETSKHLGTAHAATRDFPVLSDREMYAALRDAACLAAAKLKERDQDAAEWVRMLLGDPKDYTFDALPRFIKPRVK